MYLVTPSKDKLPYFYIIRHRNSKKMYAGCRYAKKCHPDEFFRPIKGYYTSSRNIHKLIEQDGLDSFEVLRIDTYCDGLSVLEYETIFLEINNCAESSEWINSHNNTGKSNYGTSEFYEKSKATCLERYGVDNYFKLPEKIKEAMNIKYGVDSPSKLSWIKEKSAETSILRWGTTHHMKSEEGMVNYKQNIFAKHGVDHPSKSKEIQQTKCDNYFNKTGYKYTFNNPDVISKSNMTKLEKYGTINTSALESTKQVATENNMMKYGVSSPMKLDEYKEKAKTTHLDKYGVEYPMQLDENKEKSKATCLEKYGVDHHTKNEQWKLQQKQKNLEKYGVEHHTQTPEYKENLKAARAKKSLDELENAKKNLNIKSKATCLERYGYESYAKSPEGRAAARMRAKEQRAKEPLLTCPHCSRTGKGPNMSRYHFNKCKKLKI